jgi:hypothetical protein
VVVAVPTAPASTCQQLRGEADEVICATTPRPFRAVGYSYRSFPQTSDEEVTAILRSARAQVAPPQPRAQAAPPRVGDGPPPGEDGPPREGHGPPEDGGGPPEDGGGPPRGEDGPPRGEQGPPWEGDGPPWPVLGPTAT